MGAFIVRSPSNAKTLELYPFVVQWQSLADALVRYLVKLGLERKVKRAGGVWWSEFGLKEGDEAGDDEPEDA